jgi:hypothetical protein
MLIDPDVYEKTWGIKCRAFWPGAIKKVKSDNPDFCFMAEVYWDLEWKLMQQGFDYCYDKRLYDRLKEGQCNSLREHLYADMVYQSKLARFLENHDEARAASEFPDSKHEAAAIITYFSPGLRFFHSGQLTGKKMHISPHLVRGPVEHVNERLKIFYSKLLKILSIPVFHSGTWELLTCVEAWTGNLSNHNYIAFLWIDINSVKYLVVVNFSGYQSQCYVRLPYTELLDKSWLLRDLLSSKSFERDGNELYGQGFYVDEPAWKYYIFEVKTL